MMDIENDIREHFGLPEMDPPEHLFDDEEGEEDEKEEAAS
jgi:hypothetical protein